MKLFGIWLKKWQRHRRHLIILFFTALSLFGAKEYIEKNLLPNHPFASLKVCRTNPKPYQCYMEYLVKEIERSNPETAFAAIKKEAKFNPAIELTYCHTFAHLIGRTAAFKYKTFSETNAHADPYCSSGYYHGMMEGLVSMMTPEVFKSDIRYACSSIGDKNRRGFNYFTCLHGLGHGTTVLSYYNLPMALNLCDLLEKKWEQTTCYNGAFMENLIADRKIHPTAFVGEGEPFYPCKVMAEKYQEECWNRQPLVFLRETGGSFKKTFQLCASIAEEYRPSCYRGVGILATAIKYNDFETARAVCAEGIDFLQQSECVNEAVKLFIDFRRNLKDGKKFCRTLSKSLRDPCVNSAIEYFKMF